MKKSEFGKGCSYCLGLFLAHAERFSDNIEKSEGLIGAWFNGASDHLYELVVPDAFSDKLKKRLKKFKHDVLYKGHGTGLTKFDWKKEEIENAIEEAKELLRMIDKEIGIDTIEADFK